MTYDQLLEHIGGGGVGALVRTASRLRAPIATVQSWKKRGVPRAWQFEIHAKWPKLAVAPKRRKARAAA